MSVTIKKGDAQSSLDGTKALTTVMTPVRKPSVKKQEENMISSNALQADDLFAKEYFDPKKNPEAQILRPPYDMVYMCQVAQNNNSLGQNIAAMEVNIDGTGWTVELPGTDVESDEEDDEIEGIEDFFNEPYPGESFVTQRRKLRRDLETVGNAYLEVLRAVNGDIVFLKHVDATTVRLLRLDEPVPVQKTVMRFGTELTVNMMMRERRFAQAVGERIVYFKEYGSSRDVNKKTGKWAEPGEALPFNERGTELIHFTVIKDAKTPYGVPRWITQVPSVLGSRKAEELNLDFFNAGGLPPALILVQGGQMTDEVRKQLQQYLTGKGASKHRAAIVETYSTAGSLDSNAGSVRVTVERFGAERQQDSMFEKYDERCERRVRSAFRLPPLFVGKADDYSFATAFASYAVAEAQVFQPEREEFDEVINVTVMREIAPDYVFRSMPLNVKDATQQLKGIEMVKDKIDDENLVDTVNEIVHTNLKMKEPEDMEDEPPEGEVVVPGAAPPAQPPPEQPEGAAGTQQQVQRVEKMDPMQLIQLAKEWAAYTSGAVEYEDFDVTEMTDAIKSLKGTQRDLFDSYVAMDVFSGFDHDREGASELFGCAHDVLHSHD